MLPVYVGSVIDFWTFQVIILARECGLQLELSDIKVKSLVPEPLQVLHLSFVKMSFFSQY